MSICGKQMQIIKKPSKIRLYFKKIYSKGIRCTFLFKYCEIYSFCGKQKQLKKNTSKIGSIITINIFRRNKVHISIQILENMWVFVVNIFYEDD